MAVSDFVSDQQVARIQPEDSIERAITVMREQDSHCVFVTDDDVLVGVFTERDLLIRVAAKDLDPRKTEISEVMTRYPEALHGEDDIAYAINKMAVGGYRNIPIVSDGGTLEGAVCVRDIIAHLNEMVDTGVDDKDVAAEWIDIGGGG